MANNTAFTKGDPRINRKGRPKDFDGARELARVIAQEKAKYKNGDPVVINEHVLTIVETIFRDWATSGNFQKQKAFLAYAYGEPPSQIDAKLDAEMIFKVVRE